MIQYMFKNMCMYMHECTNIYAYINDTELYRAKSCLLFPITKKKKKKHTPKTKTPDFLGPKEPVVGVYPFRDFFFMYLLVVCHFCHF